MQASMRWLCAAQDRSRSGDGGVARAYSLIHGWESSYPETTGYIVPTFLDQAARAGNEDYRARARRMLDWLVRIQMPTGAFQGGRIDSRPVAPVAFNTGQILLGLARGEREFGGYRDAMTRAAVWLVRIQDSDGCWRDGASPFVEAGEKTYDTHIAWGLLEAARLEPGRGYAESALANVRWALTHQRSNGWIDRCCLSAVGQPLTHTLGYALRGILEAFRFSRDPALLRAARSTADGLMSASREDGFLPGTLDPDWRSTVKWACLTGTVQIAWCWLTLYQETADRRYREAAFAANSFVRRTVRLEGPADTMGAVPGSFPIDGEYGSFQYPNWSAKFLIDSLALESQVRAGAPITDVE